MSTWRDKLQPASYKGVPFFVDNDSTPVGRDVVTHEYPKQEKAYVEDMGKKLRIYTMSAFVVGDDFIEKRDALLDAIDAAGYGELVHPWFGKIKVVPSGDCKLSHSRTEKGVARFDLAFIEYEPQEAPKAVANSQQQISTVSDSLSDSAIDRYKSALGNINMARINANKMQSSLSGIYNVVNQNMSPVMSLFKTSGAFVDAVINSPENLADLVLGNIKSLGSSFTSVKSSLSSLSGHSSTVTQVAKVTAPTGNDATLLHEAVGSLVQDASIVAAAQDASVIAVPSISVSNDSVGDLDSQIANPIDADEVPIYDDVIATKDALNDSIFNVAMNSDGTHYQALIDVKQAVSQHLNNVAKAGVHLMQFNPSSVTPALVLAHRLYQDATRTDEICSRNKIRHSGFVPAIDLTVSQYD